ncbi:kyphoscoliosis peptidase [Caerostris extrusa]|uniref:Kyphoscoliosis peptidase n=1 Tax=Caerostris extrusa TaxID=172846 RepID=A0AAV4PZI8_CAEEX|nr:kyphoscoliosis peptidase [Caerostris extrusa]
MGCGGSRATRLVSPLSKAVISWNSAAQPPTALQIKERLRFMSSGMLLYRLAKLRLLRTKSSKPMLCIFTEEDLETLLEDDGDEPEITDVETQTPHAAGEIMLSKTLFGFKRIPFISMESHPENFMSVDNKSFGVSIWLMLFKLIFKLISQENSFGRNTGVEWNLNSSKLINIFILKVFRKPVNNL